MQREEFGYLRFGFENFRTYDAGLGGSFAPDGLHYQLADDALRLDRGQVSSRPDLLKKNLPKLIVGHAPLP